MFRHGTIVSAVVLTGAALLVAPGMATATESPSPSYPWAWRNPSRK